MTLILRRGHLSFINLVSLSLSLFRSISMNTKCTKRKEITSQQHTRQFLFFCMSPDFPVFIFCHRDTDIHGGQKNRPEGPAFSHNHSVGVSSFSSSPAVNHRRPSPHITVGSSPPNMHSDGMSVDDEDSVDFDFDRYIVLFICTTPLI